MQCLTNIEKVEDGIKISLTPEGKEFVKELKENQCCNTQTLLDLLEYHLCNGWNWIEPGEVFALTSAPIITDSAEYDDNGVLQYTKYLYWHERYQIECPVEEMMKNGYVFFNKG